MTMPTSRGGSGLTRLVLDGRASAPVILIRLVPGAVFLSEGIQKFLYPQDLGPGRFAEAGIPAATFFGYTTAFFEVVCGALLLAGLLTRLASIPLIVDMVGAITITKVPIFWGSAPLYEENGGFWDFAHHVRTDYAMLLTLLFLVIAGGGRWSVDAVLAGRFRSA